MGLFLAFRLNPRHIGRLVLKEAKAELPEDIEQAAHYEWRAGLLAVGTGTGFIISSFLASMLLRGYPPLFQGLVVQDLSQRIVNILHLILVASVIVILITTVISLTGQVLRFRLRHPILYLSSVTLVTYLAFFLLSRCYYFFGFPFSLLVALSPGMASPQIKVVGEYPKLLKNHYWRTFIYLVLSATLLYLLILTTLKLEITC